MDECHFFLHLLIDESHFYLHLVMDNPHTGSTYTSNTVMGEFGVNDMICDGSSVCEPMVWFTMFLLLANF
jgi:hypothetical protein